MLAFADLVVSNIAGIRCRYNRNTPKTADLSMTFAFSLKHQRSALRQLAIKSIRPPVRKAIVMPYGKTEFKNIVTPRERRIADLRPPQEHETRDHEIDR